MEKDMIKQSVKTATKTKAKTMRTWLILAMIVVVLDQLSKYIVNETFLLWETFAIIPNFFDFTLRYNTGAAFNFLAKASGWQRWFLIGLGLIISAIIVLWMKRLSNKDKWEGYGLALILAGAIGNLIDRFMQGYVIDFILLHYYQWEYPAFNVADSAIFIGMVLLIPSLFKKS